MKFMQDIALWPAEKNKIYFYQLIMSSNGNQGTAVRKSM